jgi:nucleotide-binding universal stress UspA family protein
LIALDFRRPIMARIERILCAVDFSDCSRRGIDYAVAMARWYNAKVTALHVLPPVLLPPYFEAPSYPTAVHRNPQDLDKTRQELSRFAEQEGGAFCVSPMVVEGSIVNEIVRAARTSEADLLVIGTHGRSGFQRFVLGSVAESVLRHASCPVLTVPPHMADVVPADPRIFRQIVCAVDFSPCSLRALDYAASLADHAQAELVVLHVYEPVAEYVAVTVGGMNNELLRAAAERQLRDVVTEHVKAAVHTTPLLHTGKPGPEILDVAGSHAADLIVLGVAGRGAVDMAWFGSTTHHVVRHATCPVLTLRG